MSDQDKPMDSIGAYYERIAERARLARLKVQQAREAGADKATIAKLEEKAQWAGYTGD